MSSSNKTTERSLTMASDKSRRVAIALAFAGVLPIPLPLAWIHKFYIGQYLWGIVYLVLAPTGLPKVACCLEGLWYASQNDNDFNAKFPAAKETLAAATTLTRVSNSQIADIQKMLNVKALNRTTLGQQAESPAAVLRELEQLRQEGLMTEYEFEQKRRKLLDQIN